jgi:hypothetical protein
MKLSGDSGQFGGETPEEFYRAKGSGLRMRPVPGSTSNLNKYSESRNEISFP